MKLIITSCILFLLTTTIIAQDSTAILKKFDEEMIHFYKRGFLKNGNYHQLADLRLEIKPGLPSYDFYRQYRKNETNQLISSLIMLGGTALYLSALNDNNGSYNKGLFWTGIVGTAVATVFSFHFESRKIKFLTLAVKTRNREILSGAFK